MNEECTKVVASSVKLRLFKNGMNSKSWLKSAKLYSLSSPWRQRMPSLSLAIPTIVFGCNRRQQNPRHWHWKKRDILTQLATYQEEQTPLRDCEDEGKHLRSLQLSKKCAFRDPTSNRIASCINVQLRNQVQQPVGVKRLRGSRTNSSSQLIKFATKKSQEPRTILLHHTLKQML